MQVGILSQALTCIVCAGPRLNLYGVRSVQLCLIPLQCALLSLYNPADFMPQVPSLWSPALISFYPTTALASVIINVTVLHHALASSNSSMSSLLEFALPKTSSGWVYIVFLALYLATGNW